MENPIEKFHCWWREALTDSPLRQKNAVCVSTIDSSGFPSGRFVDLKSADEGGFTFCTYLDSPKGQHLRREPKAAITAWWDHAGYQVRIIGLAQSIDEAEAVRHWRARIRSAQLTTIAFDQSQPLATETELHSRADRVAAQHGAADEIPKPSNWGGYRVKPITMEFLTFQDSRLHLRELYERQGEAWTKRLLQP